MNLQPRRPPGHAKRKALAYATDVLQLRRAGHTYSAIREALQDAGVVVSISTVRREVLRGEPSPAPPWNPKPPAPPLGGAVRDKRPSETPSSSRSAAPLAGRAVAEAFMCSRPTKPLFIEEPVK